MDITQIQTLTDWIIGAVIVSIISAISGVFAIIRSGKMMPKELKGADLDNKGKEASIAGQFDDLATRAAERTLQMQTRMNELEGLYDALKAKTDVQDVLVGKQSVTIEELRGRLDTQDVKLRTQEKEIYVLRCELNNSKLYNRALIDQMKAANLVPVDINTLDIEDCSSDESQSIDPNKYTASSSPKSQASKKQKPQDTGSASAG